MTVRRYMNLLKFFFKTIYGFYLFAILLQSDHEWMSEHDSFCAKSVNKDSTINLNLLMLYSSRSRKFLAKTIHDNLASSWHIFL